MPTSLVSQGVQYPNGSIRTSGKWATRAIFGYGISNLSIRVNLTNLVNNYGGVDTDRTGVGTARSELAAAGYGGDKAIFGFGRAPAAVTTTNLVSNLGVVFSDVTNSSNAARVGPAAAGYGGDKAIFALGNTTKTTLVSNLGILASDVTQSIGETNNPAAAGYGGDKAIFAFGWYADFIGEAPIVVAVNDSWFVSNTGVFASAFAGVGTARYSLAAATYGGDKAIFGYGRVAYGDSFSITNLVSNLGVVATDTSGVGPARYSLAAAGYGGDKAIFSYGYSDNFFAVSISNLVSNLGVVASDTTGVGTARYHLAGASYSS